MTSKGGPAEVPHDIEINTDGALLGLGGGSEVLDAHDRRFGLAITHFKNAVRGRAYDNESVTLRVGRGGYYTQSKRFPMAFFGDSAKPDVRVVDEAEARSIVWEAVAHYRADEAQSLVCVYSTDDPDDVFIGYKARADIEYEYGVLKADLPVHLRVIFSAEDVVPLIGSRSGVLVYQRTRAGQHVLLRASGRRAPLLRGGMSS
ncbi:MAG TPA: hypothetical protein VF164_05890 [Trueperaceae bacterium]